MGEGRDEKVIYNRDKREIEEVIVVENKKRGEGKETNEGQGEDQFPLIV